MTSRAPMTNAERQARYRQRQKENRALMLDGKELPREYDWAMPNTRLDVVVRRGTKNALQAMARHHGMTQAAMLEAIINHYHLREKAGLGIDELLAYGARAPSRKRSVTTVTNKTRKKSAKR